MTATDRAQANVQPDSHADESELRRLMRAGLSGDAEAHRLLLMRLSSRLRAYFKVRLARLNRGPVEAEDLVQEALMAIHTRRHTYDQSQLITPWLYGIARYKFLDYLRRTRATLHDVSFDETADVMAHDDAAGIESAFDMERLLRELSPKAQNAIRLVKLEGLSIREAAARTGMSESAVKVSIHRGLKTLARLLSEGNRR